METINRANRVGSLLAFIPDFYIDTLCESVQAVRNHMHPTVPFDDDVCESIHVAFSFIPVCFNIFGQFLLVSPYSPAVLDHATFLLNSRNKGRGIHAEMTFVFIVA
jgi:hypothetical protein